MHPQAQAWSEVCFLDKALVQSWDSTDALLCHLEVLPHDGFVLCSVPCMPPQFMFLKLIGELQLPVQAKQPPP